MKRIGMTDQSGDKVEVIVHMSLEEWESFNMLEAAVDNEYPDDFWNPHTGGGRGSDITPVFAAIRQWCQLRFKVTALKRQVDYLIEELEKLPE